MSRQSPWIRIPVSEANEGLPAGRDEHTVLMRQAVEEPVDQVERLRVIDQVQVVEDDGDRLGMGGELVEQADQDLVADLRIRRLGGVAERFQLAVAEDGLERSEHGEPEARAVVIRVE